MESDISDQCNLDENSDVITEEMPQVVDESISESLEDQLAYQGPIMQSHTKALMKATF